MTGIYKNIELGVVALAFSARVIGGELRVRLHNEVQLLIDDETGAS